MRKILLVKTLAAAIVAIIITFTQAHNAILGLIGVLTFTTVMVAAEIYTAFKSTDRQIRGPIMRIAASVLVLGSLVSYTYVTEQDNYTLLIINIVIASYGFFAIEMYKSVRAGFAKDPEGRDHLTAALLNLVLLVTYLLDFAGVIKLGEIPAVGIYGAYTAMLAVLWGIKAFDPKQPS